MSDKEIFIPHLQTCEAEHDNPEWGKCGEYARYVCLDDKGRQRFVCFEHYLRTIGHVNSTQAAHIK